MNKSIRIMIYILVLMVGAVGVVVLVAGNNAIAPEATTAPFVSEPSASTEPYAPAPTAATVPQQTQPLPVVTTPVSTPTQPVTDAPATQATTEPPKQDDVALLKIMIDAVNSAKNGKDFQAKKTQKISIELTDCSISMLVKPANAILKRFASDKVKDYTFVGGKFEDKEEKTTHTPMAAIPPSDKAFALASEGVQSVVVSQENGNTVYTATLKPEAVTYNSCIPQYHSQAMDYLDIGSVDISPAKIDEASINYKGATIIVKINSAGQIIEYYELMPIEGHGTGSLGMSASATISGALEERWNFTW